MKLGNNRQLKVLNVLVAAATGSDSATAREVEAAIDFSSARKHGSFDLESVAEGLLKLHCGDRVVQLACCELHGSENAGSLWILECVRDSLSSIAPDRDALLVVRGLKSSVCAGRRFSSVRQREYSDLVAQIERLAARHMREGSLNLIML